MADLSDVEDALADLIAPPFYPAGTASAPAIPATMVKIYPGWPQSDALNKDVRANKVNVSIFASRLEKNVTRYMREWREVHRDCATLAVAITGGTLTITGTIAVNQNIAVQIRDAVYSYQVKANDTLASAASGVASLINADYPGTAVATDNTVVADGLFRAHIGVKGRLAREVRRTQKQFIVTIWAPSDALRIAAAKLLDPVVSSITYLDFADGSQGLVTYVSSTDNDDPQEALIYRRDIVFWVEYPTLEIIDGSEVIAGEMAYNGSQQSSAVAPRINVFTDTVVPETPGWPGAEW